MMAEEGLDYLLKNFEFDCVLDIGCGSGDHSSKFLQLNKEVHGVEFKPITKTLTDSKYFTPYQGLFPLILTKSKDLFDMVYSFDCVWASHVLEHSLQPHDFLKNMVFCVREGGIIAVTVPPLKHQIVGGHVSLWNAGMLLYHLILAGVDCADARIKSYGYNITIIIPKVRKLNAENLYANLVYDKGDIATLSPYLPKALRGASFDGDIKELNW